MSPLVTWPRTPVPATADGSTPLSAASLRTEGGIGMSDAFAAGAGAAAGFAGSGGLAEAAGLAAGFAAAPAPS